MIRTDNSASNDQGDSRAGDARPALPPGVVIGCLSNDAQVLSENLMRSPMVRAGGISVDVETGARSAASGYNRILDRTAGPFVILAHQDVYLPEGWDRLLAARIAEVAAVDPDWGVIAAYGIGYEGAGWGPVWSTSIGQIVGRVALDPVPIQSADELLIVLRRHEALRFDEDLPHFHFHGLDIVQTALSRGHGAYAAALPLIHNDAFKPRMDENFDRGYNYMRRKWRAVLPLQSPTVKIAWHGLHLRAVKRRMKESFETRQAITENARRDPVFYAERCGWSRL